MNFTQRVDEDFIDIGTERKFMRWLEIHIVLLKVRYLLPLPDWKRCLQTIQVFFGSEVIILQGTLQETLGRVHYSIRERTKIACNYNEDVPSQFVENITINLSCLRGMGMFIVSWCGNAPYTDYTDLFNREIAEDGTYFQEKLLFEIIGSISHNLIIFSCPSEKMIATEGFNLS